MKVHESANFEAEGQHMNCALQQGAQRWSVKITVREGGKLVSSGYCGVGPEAEVRKLWTWTLQQAVAKRWRRNIRAGRVLPILPGVPEPGARGTAAVGAAPAVKRGPGRPKKVRP